MDLSDKEITWAQEKVQLETQLEAVRMQQPHHPAGSTKSKQMSNPAIFDGN